MLRQPQHTLHVILLGVEWAQLVADAENREAFAVRLVDLAGGVRQAFVCHRPLGKGPQQA